MTRNIAAGTGVPLIACFVLGATHQAVAQFVPFPPEPTAAQCTQYGNIIASASAGADSNVSVWNGVVYCPSGGQYIATAMNKRRTSSDTTIWSRLIASSIALSDARIARAASTVAGATASSATARGAALIMLVQQWRPGTYVPPGFAFGSGPVNAGCSFGSAGSTRTVSGQANPTTLGAQIQSVAASILGSASSPSSLKRIAACAFNTANYLEPPAVSASKILLSYVCGNTFVIRNRNYSDVDVRYIEPSGKDTTAVTLYAASPLAPNEDLPIILREKGSARLSLNGTIIRTTANTGTTCR